MSAQDRSSPGADGSRCYGVLAEFEDLRTFMAATERVRDAGYRRWDTHTPFPVHGLNDAMGLSPTRLPWWVLGGGALGLGGALLLQWWTNAVDYPYIISGKPLFSLPANIPITFEGTVLVAALVTFLGMLVKNDLPRWHHPLFHSDRFRRATADRFFISVEARDPAYDPDRLRHLFEELGADAVELVSEDPPSTADPTDSLWESEVDASGGGESAPGGA